MNENLDLKNILFLDIETVSNTAQLEDQPAALQALWGKKCQSILKKYDQPVSADEMTALYEEKAGIFAEFGKIICISVGLVYFKDNEMRVRLKSFASDNEEELLKEFLELVSKSYNQPRNRYFCGHNIKEFDIPYICRRSVINQLPLPQALNLSGKKPWECPHMLDTMEMWKFGDRKNYTSLKLLAAILDIPSPKDDIDGSEVGRVYWNDKDLPRIATYCEKDVLATIQLYLRYRRLPILTGEQVEYSEA